MVLRILVHLAEAGVIAILLSAAGIAPSRLDMAVGFGADPDIGSGRRHRQSFDPLQGGIILYAIAAGQSRVTSVLYERVTLKWWKALAVFVGPAHFGRLKIQSATWMQCGVLRCLLTGNNRSLTGTGGPNGARNEPCYAIERPVSRRVWGGALHLSSPVHHHLICECARLHEKIGSLLTCSQVRI